MDAKREIITSDDILGKEALDPEGEFIGIVMKLHIDRQKKELVGVTVDQGFMKPDLFIGLDAIDKFGIDTLFINKIPFTKYEGCSVYSPSGKIAGIVAKILEENGNIQKMEILTPKKKLIQIPASGIASLGNSIILKTELSELT